MIVSRQIRAPRQHGAVVADPPLSETGGLLARNQQVIERYRLDFLGRPLEDLRREARQIALTTATQYLRSRGEPTPPLTDPWPGAFLLCGHQPELFHPGVWVKNFAVNGQARRHAAASINLLIDTDAAKTPSLRLPGWECGAPVPECDPAEIRHLSIPYDRWTKDIPYEDRAVLDAGLFETLGERVAPFVQGWKYTPILHEFWGEVRRPSRPTELLGERVAAARRVFERRWGCHNWEVPMSRLCETEPFAWFACHLLANLPRFHRVYNACLHDYRRANSVRSPSRPVPDLAIDGEWLEVPLWAWQRGHGRRGRLFARPGPAAVALKVDEVTGPILPLPPNHDASRAVAVWRDSQASGFKIRSRALTTMLFARLFVADLFVHGIGGGIYDSITDEIIRRFFAVEPPGYQVLSATLLLPLPAYQVDAAPCRRLAWQLRDVQWNPQRHVPPAARADPAVERLVAEKLEWIAREPSHPVGRLERFHRLRRVSQTLGQLLDGRPHKLAEEVRTCQRRLAANEVLQRRDYAFCLYPEDLLKTFLTAFL